MTEHVPAARVRQVHIEDQHLRPLFAKQPQGVLAGAGVTAGMAPGTQVALDDTGDQLLGELLTLGIRLVRPGATTLTVIPRAPDSKAHCVANTSIAPYVAPYTALPSVASATTAS